MKQVHILMFRDGRKIETHIKALTNLGMKIKIKKFKKKSKKYLTKDDNCGIIFV